MNLPELSTFLGEAHKAVALLRAGAEALAACRARAASPEASPKDVQEALLGVIDYLLQQTEAAAAAADGQMKVIQDSVDQDTELARSTAEIRARLESQVRRVRDEVVPAYRAIGNAGTFALGMMAKDLADADAALASGNAVEMQRLAASLAGYTT